MRRVIAAISVAVILLAGSALFAKRQLDVFMHSPMALPENGASFEIKAGSSFHAVNQALVKAGLIEDAPWFRLYARWHQLAENIQAGDYQLTPGTTPREALQLFIDGKVRLYSFTLIEGWNHREMLAALQANEAVSTTLDASDWPDFLAQLAAEQVYPEGLFLPETYRFPKGSSDRDILTQAYNLMQTTLAEEWQRRSPEAVLESPYDTLILASIIEKETARADERELISGVFTRRIKIRMRLQTDPTVIYGIGPTFNGNLTRKDLTTDTPYNTYTRHGLPPTPIAMPGKASIRAALNPADGETLYFVATGLGDGSHYFSATKEEHDHAVREYLKRLRSQR